MEIRNLRTFLQVAALENFTKAAAVLGYSQSAVSVQIKQLENETGLALFDRIGKNAYLTDYGRALMPYARKAVAAADAVENFGRAPEELSGTVRIGITDSLFELLVKETLINYHLRFPKVELELTVDTTVELLRGLKEGSIDAACVIDDALPDGQWNIWRRLETPVVLAANPMHSLARLSEVPMRALAGSEFIMMEHDAPYSRRFESVLTRFGVEYNVFLRLPSAAAAKELLTEGDFISLLPLYTVQPDVIRGSLSILNVPEWNLEQSVQMVMHRGKIVTPQLEGFLTELCSALASVLHR